MCICTAAVGGTLVLVNQQAGRAANQTVTGALASPVAGVPVPGQETAWQPMTSTSRARASSSRMQPGSSTGAPGTPGGPVDTPGAALESVPVSPVYDTSQVPAPRVLVDTGDTARPSQISEAFSGQGPDVIASTGAGAGHVGGPGNPNSMSRQA